jgi:hypothetical protein
MATPILSNKDKYPLAMFMLTFVHGEDIKKLFEICIFLTLLLAIRIT